MIMQMRLTSKRYIGKSGISATDVIGRLIFVIGRHFSLLGSQTIAKSVCFIYFITTFVLLQEKRDIFSQFFSYLGARNLLGEYVRNQ